MKYRVVGIAPLKKALILDACHSGEIDKESISYAENTQQNESNIQFRTIGDQSTRAVSLDNSFELSKTLFVDLRKGTGTDVISSAGGLEFAIEGDEWSNGLFTYSFLSGIVERSADLDNDGKIYLSEIKAFVSSKVSELSKGLQVPTSRVENKRQDQLIWQYK